MKWLIVAILVVTQQPAKAPASTPASKGTAESHDANSARSTEAAQANQDKAAQPAPVSSHARTSTEGTKAPSTRENETSQSDQRANNEDRAIQRSLARFNGALATLAFLQLIVMFLTLLVYRRQAREMRRQRHEMRRQRHIMYRQWKAMHEQLKQMESAGNQTNSLIQHAEGQVKALVDAATAAKDNAAAAKENAKAAQSSADALIHSQRPWIIMLQLGVVSPLTFDEQGAHITLNVTLQNVGHMPAEGVWLHPVLSVKGDATAERKKICSELSPKLGWLGAVVFPNQTWVQNLTITANATDIEARCREIFGDRFDEPPFVPFSVIVAVQYTTGIDPDTILYTAAIFDLRRIEDGHPAMLKRENIPASSLQLQLSAIAGVIAK